MMCLGRGLCARRTSRAALGAEVGERGPTLVNVWLPHEDQRHGAVQSRLNLAPARQGGWAGAVGASGADNTRGGDSNARKSIAKKMCMAVRMPMCMRWIDMRVHVHVSLHAWDEVRQPRLHGAEAK